MRIRSDHGGEFENTIYAELCEKYGISHEFFAPKTPKQNRVFKRKKRTFQGDAQQQKLPVLWAEAVSTACYIINRVYVQLGMEKIPYEIWRGKKPNLSHFHIFGSKYCILNDKDHLRKFDSKSDKGIFLGYSNNSREYCVYNMRTQTIMESANVVVDDFNDFWKK